LSCREGDWVKVAAKRYTDDEGLPGSQLSVIAGHLPSHRGIARTMSSSYLIPEAAQRQNES
jgi:hypothetical protein